MRRLIIRPGAIGDFIVSLPALEALRAGYTEVWTSETNRPLARFADRVDSIFSTGLDVFGLPGRPENQRLFHRLQSFDSIVSWYGAGRPDFREFIESLNLPFEFHRALPPEGIGLHAVDYYLTQAGAPCGAAPAIFTLRKPLDAIVVHPFSGSIKKNWTLDRFRRLAAALADEGLGPVLWSAGPEDAIADAVRFDELGALADWLSGARLYIGNDSGISHLAAAVGVPVVALFGPTKPEIWAPRGPKVRVVRGSNGSVQSITVAEVLAAVREVHHTGPRSIQAAASTLMSRPVLGAGQAPLAGS